MMWGREGLYRPVLGCDSVASQMSTGNRTRATIKAHPALAPTDFDGLFVRLRPIGRPLSSPVTLLEQITYFGEVQSYGCRDGRSDRCANQRMVSK